MAECIKTTVELPASLARQLKDLAKASDLNRQQYVRRVLAAAAADRVVFEAAAAKQPTAPQLELLAAEPPPSYGEQEGASR